MPRGKLRDIYSKQPATSDKWTAFESAIKSALEIDIVDGLFVGDVTRATAQMMLPIQAIFASPTAAIKYFDHPSFVGNHSASIYDARLPNISNLPSAPLDLLLSNLDHGGRIALQTLKFADQCDMDLGAVYTANRGAIKPRETSRPDIKIFSDAIHKAMSDSLLAKASVPTSPKAKELAAFVVERRFKNEMQHHIFMR